MMLTLSSPAKINLFLRILNKRSDGYHEIASLFQAIDLKDSLSFSLSNEDSLTCSDPTLSCDHTNLIHKALKVFRKKTGLQFSIKIHLDKSIPTQAGLGGGSSNAATTLWALNALHNHKYTDEELGAWGSEIGSDISFFFSEGTAYCTGRGEHVRPLKALELPPFCIFKPHEGLSTPAVYRALCLNECSQLDPEKLLTFFYEDNFKLVNDLETPAFKLLPALHDYKKALLEKGCTSVIMSGSGTALIGFGKSTYPEIAPLRRSPGTWYN